MTEPNTPLLASPGRLIAVLTVGLCVLLLAEWGSARLLSEAPSEPAGAIHRPDNVVLLPKTPAALPPPLGDPEVWLIGNSHTYALPGLKQGDPLRDKLDGIIIDELAARVAKEHPKIRADFYLLSYPNFLPFEMLTRVDDLLEHGYRPKIVIVGLTWRNIARDSQPRHEVYTTYRDPEFTAHLRKLLEDERIEDNADILAQIAAQEAQAEHEKEVERLKSDSDKIDEQLTAWLRERLTLMGKSADLRAHIFRLLSERVQRTWADRDTTAFTYDLVKHDYDFNRKCLWATLRLLRSTGATVICYYAPERSDLAPLMDPKRQNDFFHHFEERARDMGITVVDARQVVPNDYWGWVGESADRAHFTQPGHQLLAQFLYDAVEKQSAWKELDKP